MMAHWNTTMNKTILIASYLIALTPGKDDEEWSYKNIDIITQHAHMLSHNLKSLTSAKINWIILRKWYLD